VRLDLGGGTFRDGTNLRAVPSIEWRPSQHWLLSFTYRLNQFWIPGHRAGDCDDPLDCLGTVEDQNLRTHLTQLNVKISFTPDISWNTSVQWDNVSESMGINSIFRWIITEGTDFFIVLNQDFVTEDGRVTAGRTEPLIKLDWTFRF
jgi:hypothetical protein